jgi:hypothetical protein
VLDYHNKHFLALCPISIFITTTHLSLFLRVIR